MKNMKKIMFGLIMGLLLVSCSKSSSDESASNSGVYKWQFKLNGVLYQWQGNQLNDPNSGGVATYSGNNLVLQNNTVVSLAMTFPTSSVGNFTFSGSAGSPLSINLVGQGISGMHSTSYGGTMNVTISSLSTSAFDTNPTNPGKVIGIFSGTIKSATGSIVSVTEGSFEALRAH